MLVGLLFTAACSLPAISRASALASVSIWPLSATAVFFALLAWLNCHAIERWESEPSQQVLEECFSGAKQSAEKRGISGEIAGKRPSGAEAHIDSVGFMRGLKPPPPFGSSFSAACKALALSAGFMRGLKPPPPAGSCFRAACVLAAAGMFLAFVLSQTQARCASLAAAGAGSAFLLALLDRFRNRLTPLALRAAADLVLLTPVALLTPALLLR